jgi:DegV family protein with EDD domain
MAAQFCIITESSCDLSPERINALDILVVPIPLTINGNTYRHYPDGRELSYADFYQKLRERADIKTAAPSPEEFRKVAEPALKAGKDVLYLGISSTLSGTFQSGTIAFAELQERYPQRSILCVDTVSGAMGEALLVEMAARARSQGMGPKKTAELINASKLNAAHLFTLDQLDFLRRSGRLPAFQAMVGTILQIKPILQLDSEGSFKMSGKVRSYQKALANLYDMTISKAKGIKNQIIYISHADVRQAAEGLADKFRRVGAREVVVTLLGPAIAAHFGIGGIGVSFLANER